MITIKVLGPGCANCRRVEEVARKAIEALGVEAQVEKVTDTSAILAYDILATPGVVINDKVVSTGRIPTVGTMSDWIRAASGG